MIVKIKKEINISNATIANDLFKDGSIFENIDENISDILCNQYEIDYSSSQDAVNQITSEDYVEILTFLAKKLQNTM